MSGNQTEGDATAPVDASDNQVTVIGDDNRSSSTDQGGSSSSGQTSTGDTTSGADGTGSGNQTDAGATAPVDVSDNQVTVIGDGNTNDGAASDTEGTSTGGSGGDTTDGDSAEGSGNQTDAQATAPVTLSGNQVTVIGDGQVADVQPGENGVEPSASPDGTSGDGTVSGSGDTTSGADGTGSGNQTDLDAVAPVDASGNQVTVIGDDNTNQSSSTSGSGSSAGTTGAGDETSGADGTASGNQTDANALVPVDATGNQVTVIGDGNSTENTSSSGGSSDGSATDTTTGDDGTVAGNQTGLGAVVPVDASGNQVTVIGDGNTSTGESAAGDGPATGTGTGNTTSGEDGTGSGNQTEPTLSAPVDAGDNQVTVIGNDNTSETTDDSTGTDTTGGSTTDGEDGTGSGNQTAPGLEAPVDTSDNQVTVIGDGNENDQPDSSNGEEETDPDEPGEGPTSGNGTEEGDAPAENGSGTEAGSTGSATVAAPAQGGPVAAVATALPQTGAAAGLVLWGALGLVMLLLGLVLLAGRRRRGPALRDGREVSLVG